MIAEVIADEVLRRSWFVCSQSRYESYRLLQLGGLAMITEPSILCATSTVSGVPGSGGRRSRRPASVGAETTNQRGEILAIDHHFNIAREMQGDAWTKSQPAS
jgi:hypothetical protein